MATIEAILDDFDLIDDWEERYRYLIDLGRALPPMPEALRTEETKVRGCASQVWLASAPSGDGRLAFVGDSDAHIVRGLVALVLAIYSGRTPAEIAAIDADAVFARIGLREHLTPQRSNGVTAMVVRIRRVAAAQSG